MGQLVLIQKFILLDILFVSKQFSVMKPPPLVWGAIELSESLKFYFRAASLTLGDWWGRQTEKYLILIRHYVAKHRTRLITIYLLLFKR